MKDCIDEFDIVVDISDRTELYDYATCKEVHREGKQWNKDQFRGLGGTSHVDHGDENMMLQISCMDNAFSDTHRLQIKADEKQSFHNAADDDKDASHSLPRRVLPVYKPGDVVKGHLNLKVKKSIEADNLSINFLGAGCVQIRVYNHTGAYADNTNQDKFIDEDIILWEKSKDKGNDKTDDFSQLTIGQPPSGKVIAPGEYCMPFEFTIPLETAQSCPNLHNNDPANFCYVVYRLKATLNSGKSFSRGDVVTHRGIWVTDILKYDIGKDLEAFNPFTTEETLGTGLIFKSGRISVKATLLRKSYIRGEDIPITLEIDNQTEGAIDKVTAFIYLHGKFKLSGRIINTSKQIDVKGKKMVKENVSSGMCPAISWVLPWDFSESSVDNNLMPTGTLDDCKLIDIRYDVMVKLKRSGLHRNISMQIPIYIGSYNSREEKDHK